MFPAIFNIVATLLIIIEVIFNLWITIATFSLTVRRLHDTGRSHWHVTFIYILFPSGFFLVFLLGSGGLLVIEAFIIGLTAAILGGLYPLVLMFFKSQPGTNKWGDTPEKHFGFIEASRKLFINWLDFKSRSRRSEYWWTWVTGILIAMLLLLLRYMF